MAKLARALQPSLPLTPPPTAEQSHILELVKRSRSNLLINALAGSGKTTTLEMIQDALAPPVLCLAFNKRIADVMVKRFRATTTVRTFNGLGHRIWSAACAGRVSLDPKKVPDLLRELIKELPRGEQGEAWKVFWEVIGAIGLAKSLGYVPEGKYPNAKRLIEAEAFYSHFGQELGGLGEMLAETVLTRSIKASYAGLIDYNDQCYMPALFGGTYPKFPNALIDEMQDLSPVNHEMLVQLRHSRLIAVGDPWQSIYAFRGAATSGMAKAKARFEMIEADLSVSFRCPSAVVKAVHWRVPHMKWSKEGGRVGMLKNPSLSSFTDGSVIICRNNAPLFALALKLLSSGRSVSVAGSDVGPRVIGIMRRLGEDSDKQEEVLDAINKWEAEKLAKGSTTAQDIGDCMRVFARTGTTLGRAVAYADHLFKQTGSITLLTGHKAKGLEWPTVFHLDSWLLRPDEQDQNLRYVITTRAMERYFETNSVDIR